MHKAPYCFTRREVTKSFDTPQWFFDELNAEFHFDIDVAASAENSKCKRYFTYADNALEQDWEKQTCWCNPPFGLLRFWLKKAWEESVKGSLVVMLAPVRSETKAWQEYVIGKKAEVRFLPYKLKFHNMKNHFPYSLALLVWRSSRFKQWGSIGGRLSSSRMTAEARRARALKAVEAREAKRAQRLLSVLG